jgi:hypothetical protein
MKTYLNLEEAVKACEEFKLFCNGTGIALEADDSHCGIEVLIRYWDENKELRLYCEKL